MPGARHSPRDACARAIWPCTLVIATLGYLRACHTCAPIQRARRSQVRPAASHTRTQHRTDASVHAARLAGDRSAAGEGGFAPACGQQPAASSRTAPARCARSARFFCALRARFFAFFLSFSLMSKYRKTANFPVGFTFSLYEPGQKNLGGKGGGFTIGEAPLYMSVEHATSQPRCEAHVPGRKG